MRLEIVQMEIRHAAMIERQNSQATTLGVHVEMNEEYGQAILSTEGEAWAAVEISEAGERVVALFGLMEAFRAKQATGWAVFSSDIGVHHLPITRFARDRIVNAYYSRTDLITECADAEPLLERLPDLDPGELLALLTAPHVRTPGVRWALAIGMKPAAVLRKYGQASETHMLFERIGR